MTTEINSRMETVRLAKKLSREKLARLADVSYQSIFLYEKSGRIPAADKALRIAEVLETTVADLWGTS